MLAVLAGAMAVSGAPLQDDPLSSGRAERSGLTDGPRIPSIAVQPIPEVPAAAGDPRALPPGAKAVLPEFDGDAVLVSIAAQPATSVSSQAVFDETIAPVLRAAGHPERGAGVFAPTGPEAGIELPRAQLSTIAAATCEEFQGLSPEEDPVCAAMTGRAPPSREVEQAFLDGQGMTFDQFKADLEQQRVRYVFSQRVNGVAIEHAGLIAERAEGETVSTVHGSLFTRFGLANEAQLEFADAASRAVRRIARMRLVEDAAQPEQGELVLLPYGGTTGVSGGAVPAMRFAFRTIVLGSLVPTPTSQEPTPTPMSWLTYIDAATGEVLKLEPQGEGVAAKGERWRRAPDTATTLSDFSVDKVEVDGQPPAYQLQRSGVFNRIDRLNDGDFDDSEVSIPTDTNGSTSTFANFNQAPLNDDVGAVCDKGGNKTFRQVNLFAHLSRFRAMVVGAGTLGPFPESAITVWIDAKSSKGTPTSSFAHYDKYGPGKSWLQFGTGDDLQGSTDCPGVGQLNHANDPTITGHEFAHLIVPRLTDRRPADWCADGPPCPMPTGRSAFHDFADALAGIYSSTNCVAGWSFKNKKGTDASLNCVANSSEGGGLPRLAVNRVPFLPGQSKPADDHFPEHRLSSTSGYGDGQIASAALWSVRQGMRSKCLTCGTPQFFSRLMKALQHYGFRPDPGETITDRELDEFLWSLENAMVSQWASAGEQGNAGSHTTNKVTAGFARAGLFLVPPSCIDGNSFTAHRSYCPKAKGGENGGDAVIDIDDNNPADDTTIDAVVNPENDYLRRAGGPPSFHVWTGPRYQFNLAGDAKGFTPSNATPSPCHQSYQVEMSTTPGFVGSVVTDWINVARATDSPGTVPLCYDKWTPSDALWNRLKGVSGETKLYYRVRTRAAVDDVEGQRISTKPGSGLYDVSPPYAVINTTGQPPLPLQVP